MTKLSINVNKVALLRNSRTIGIPSVTQAAEVCMDSGCHGITVHPRPDERHITYADTYALADLIGGRDGIEYNIEGNPHPKWLQIVKETKPDQATLVPDDPNAFTSDHGWDLNDPETVERLKPIIGDLKDLGIRVSLFMDSVPAQIQVAAKIGADRIELYTEPYATAHREQNVAAVFREFADGAKTAQDSDIGVNAGHDLNLENLGEFVTIPGILEVSIGHALIGDAIFMGLEKTVDAYLEVLGY
ncbi:MAG: pyridoxine 5'-phosphate synthase [Gemmatimonadetes bacterium]|nr:pyridoxine 5'-phosphate synthase [Gemmatimonadota bacterium]